MSDFDVVPDVDPERGSNRVASIAVLICAVAAVVASATAWLILTDPVTVASAVDQGEISPVVRQLADVIYNALATLLGYL